MNVENFIKTINDKATAMSKLAGDLQQFANSIDWESQCSKMAERITQQKNTIMERAATLKEEFSAFIDDIKENVLDFKTTIPFNKANENLEWNVQDGILTVTVTYRDKNVTRISETKVTVPENSDVNRITVEKDGKGGAVVTIPKKRIEQPSEQNSEQPSNPPTSFSKSKLEEKIIQNVGKVAENNEDFNLREVTQ